MVLNHGAEDRESNVRRSHGFATEVVSSFTVAVAIAGVQVQHCDSSRASIER